MWVWCQMDTRSVLVEGYVRAKRLLPCLNMIVEVRKRGRLVFDDL